MDKQQMHYLWMENNNQCIHSHTYEIFHLQTAWNCVLCTFKTCVVIVNYMSNERLIAAQIPSTERTQPLRGLHTRHPPPLDIHVNVNRLSVTECVTAGQ